MTSESDRHPTPETLEAFVHGQLEDPAQSEVESHVLECEQCVESLRSIPADDLLQQIREADLSTKAATRIQETDSGDSFELDSGEISHQAIAALADHPRYRLIEKLGAGGMGVVYKAEHRVMERVVAVKVITPTFVSHSGAVERFRQEVKAAAKLSHRNIVTAYDAEQVGDLHFLVMEYVDGMSLDAYVAKHGRLSVKRACHFIGQAALGLQHAHEQGMVHRDIKPQNLICTSDNIVKILDFGLARLAMGKKGADDSTGITAVGMTVGTPDYIAPEQARDSRSVDSRADIYSLGCTLYYLLSGQTPFPDGGALEKVVAHIERTPPSITTLRNDLPAEFVTILDRMLIKDPGKRFQTPGEVAEALKPFVRKSDDKTPPSVSHDENRPLITAETEPIRSRSTAKRGGFPTWGYGAIAIAVIGILASFFFPGPDDDPSPSPTPGGSPTEGEWIDVLSEFRPDQTLSGNWEQRDGELHVSADDTSRWILPHEPSGEYDLEMTFTRHAGQFSIAMIFSLGDGQASFEMDAWGRGLAGLQVIGWRTLQDEPERGASMPIVNDQPYTMRLEVRRHSARAFVNEQPVSSYEGDGSDLSLTREWDWPPDAEIGLGVFQCDVTIHRVRIHPR